MIREYSYGIEAEKVGEKRYKQNEKIIESEAGNEVKWQKKVS
jgi:hypothetical protein